MTTNNAVNNDLSNPIIRTGIKDSNGNEILAFTATASAVNYFALQNTPTGNIPTFYIIGSDTNIPMFIIGKGTGGINIGGTGTNDNAPAGYVGEYITSNIPLASATSLANVTPKNITSISLTAGDWDVFGNVYFTGTGVTNPQFLCWISLTSATVPDDSLISQITYVVTGLSITAGLICPFLRVSISSTTTIYLSADTAFAAGSVTGCGSIFARRVR